MNWKKITISGILGGIVLWVIGYVIGLIVQMIAPYNVLELGGMRSITDPIIIGFFAYPWITSFTAAIAFDKIKEKITRINFGLLLFLVVTIPSTYVIYTSMTYPIGFHLETIISGLLGFSALGILFAKIWEK